MMYKAVIISLSVFLLTACSSGDGRTASREPAGIALQIPELGLTLPFSAIGSGYANNAH